MPRRQARRYYRRARKTRRFTRRRRYARRRRVGRTRYTYGRVYSFKRTIENTATYDYNAGNNGFVSEKTTFDLASLPSSSEFALLYSKYFISGIKFTIIPNVSKGPHIVVDPQGVPINYNVTPPIMFLAASYDGYGITDLNDLNQRYSVKRSFNGRSLSLFIRPRVACTVYESVTSSGYSYQRKWIDMTDPSVPHYGINWGFYKPPDLGPNASPIIKPLPAVGVTIRVTFYVRFRGVK